MSGNDLDALLGSASDEDDDVFEEEKEPAEEPSQPAPIEKNDILASQLGESDDDDDDDDQQNFLQFLGARKSQGSSTTIKETSVSDVSQKITSTQKAPAISKEKRKNRVVLSRIQKFDSSKSQNKAIFLRTPIFLKIQSEEYNDDTNLAHESKVFNAAPTIIRYRKAPTGDGFESNARLLKWSDGSCQLVVGDATFNARLDTLDNCYVFQQQQAAAENDVEDETQSAKSVLGYHLECSGLLNNRMIVQPTSLDSDIHTRMALNVTAQHKRERKINIHDNDTVPENLEKREQEENKRLKEEQARLAKEADSNNKNYIVNTKRNSYSHLGPGMNASYLQDFEQEASPTKFKRSSKKDRDDDRGMDLGSEDSYSEDEEEPDDEDNAFIDNDGEEGADDVEDQSLSEEEGSVQDGGEDSEGGDDNSEVSGHRGKKKGSKGETKKGKDKKKNKKSKKQKSKEIDRDAKRKRDGLKVAKSEVSGEEDVVPQPPASSGSASGQLASDDDEEQLQQPQRKKAKKVLSSDDEDN